MNHEVSQEICKLVVSNMFKTGIRHMWVCLYVNNLQIHNIEFEKNCSESNNHRLLELSATLWFCERKVKTSALDSPLESF